jgi:hypothetical protein
MDDMEYKQHELDGSLDISEDITKQPTGMLADTRDVIIMDGANEEQSQIFDAHNGDTDSNKSTATEAPEVALTNKSRSGFPLLQDPPSILKRQKNKQSMLQAAASGTKVGINPFFAPGNTNKEGIPVEDFKNIIFLEPTIMVPSKPVEFSGTALKWALQQFMEWFEQAREDLSDNVSLILLSYSKSSSKEPEVMRDVSKFLKGMVNMLSKHVFNFQPNNKAFSKGNEYQLYCKICIRTVFGEDLQQLMEDLCGVSSKVMVFKSVLQCSNTQVINFFPHLTVTWVLHG